jgi:tetratricopeptide (TPR) repeat protein
MSLPDVQELRARDDEVMARADGLAKAGRVDEALAFYRTILVDQLNPWDTDALFRFLWLCGKHGRLADGFPIAVSAAEGYGPHHAFRRRWAWGLIAQSYPLEPTPYLRIAAMGKEAGPRSDPDGLDASDRALLQSAYVRFRELGMDAAADALKAAAEFGPDDVKRSRAERLLDAAQSARYQARDAEAEEKLREALAIAPELSREAASAHEDLRALRLDLADLARAREHSRMLASLAARRGDADAARRHEEEARTQDPADAGAWLRLGERLDREGRAQPAAIAYEKALACDPSAIEAWFGLGRLAHWRGDAGGERRIHDRLEALDESRARAFRAEFLEAAERRPTRRLSFPEAEVGRLAARPVGQPDAWRPIGPARGAVYVPGGKDVRLEVADTHRARDLSFLRALTPDALQELILDELELSDEALAHAAHLTGLECLSIQATAMAASGVLDEPWIGIGMKLGDDSLWRGLGITGRALYHLRGLAGLARWPRPTPRWATTACSGWPA